MPGTGTSKPENSVTNYPVLNFENDLTLFPFFFCQDKPRVNKTGRAAVIKSWLRRNSTLNCQAEGNPTPNITWSKDRNVRLGSKSANIFIRPHDDKDFGNYTCTASNALGTDSLHVRVVRTGQENSSPWIKYCNLHVALWLLVKSTVNPLISLLSFKPLPWGCPFSSQGLLIEVTDYIDMSVETLQDTDNTENKHVTVITETTTEYDTMAMCHLSRHTGTFFDRL